MLADQLAAAVDQLLSAFLLQGLIVPAAGEGHVHGDGGADGLGAQIEGGVAGDHFGVGERTNVAHLGLSLGELAGSDHLVHLHTGSDTGQITALIDGGESVVVVGQALGVGAGAGGVAELHVGEVLGGLDHVGLMTKAVGKDDVAAGVGQLGSGVVALLTFLNVGLEDVVILGETQVRNGLLGSVDEVQVVGGVLIVQGDEAHLDGSSLLAAVVGDVGSLRLLLLTAGHQAQSHDQGDDQCKELFHSCFPPFNM